ncbi:MAG: hypothetical protein KME13_22865, partial [Myxacorys californica WJT36-NPBG1]|nr:hypothetical protein [Myxacorys californica WJT36-NPBG1]
IRASSSATVSRILMRLTPTIAVFLHTVELSLSFVALFFQFGITALNASTSIFMNNAVNLLINTSLAINIVN